MSEAFGDQKSFLSFDVCQICQPETGTPVVVTATGSKYHCSGCRTVAKPTPVELIKCPIYFDKSGEKTEGPNSFSFLVAQVRKGV